MAHQSKGKKNRKVGRHAVFCAAYRKSNRRERNKLRRVNIHLDRFPKDASALAAKAKLKTALGILAEA